ncbi:MAG: glycoside hydrolase family 5 protein [Tepidisphaerales bacterium]
MTPLRTGPFLRLPADLPSRRQLLSAACIAAAGLLSPTTRSATFHTSSEPSATSPPAVPQPSIPRWRGFNLLERFSSDWGPPQPFRELDLELTRTWGFDFLRIPMDYRFWGSQRDYFEFREADLAEIDRLIGLARQYRLHVCLNFHRAPGYCVNEPKEPTVLWDDPRAMDACEHHWEQFARRYRDVPAAELSFNLLNEPGEGVLPEVYDRFCRRMAAAIRRHSPDRLVIVDGLRWGTRPLESLWDLSVVQSGRGYAPFGLTHYRASWVRGSDTWSVPTWPGDGWDAQRLNREAVAPWRDYLARGGAVHIGEFGCFNRTPHAVALAWMRDLLSLWKRDGIGWALWNLRGGFGVADSDRPDVAYDTVRGVKVDRAMLELLQSM